MKAERDESRKTTKLEKDASFAGAFRYAFRGLAHVFKTQRNMKIHVFFAFLAIVACFLLRVGLFAWLAILGCIALVFALECVNTAIEAITDLVSPGYHELAARVKDCAAAAVLVAAILSLVVGALVYAEALLRLLA